MPTSERFRYVEVQLTLGNAGALPYIPLSLRYQQNSYTGRALVDSGSALNVLPFDVGIQLGADWNQQTIRVKLIGNLAALEARAILLTGVFGQFAPVTLAFAWTESNQVPIILGQVNFFMEFDVCFFRSVSAFEIKPKGSNGAALD